MMAVRSYHVVDAIEKPTRQSLLLMELSGCGDEVGASKSALLINRFSAGIVGKS
jgi:hypothetical protein